MAPYAIYGLFGDSNWEKVSKKRKGEVIWELSALINLQMIGSSRFLPRLNQLRLGHSVCSARCNTLISIRSRWREGGREVGGMLYHVAVWIENVNF